MMTKTKANLTLKIGFSVCASNNQEGLMLEDINGPFPPFLSFTDWLIWPFHVPDPKYFHVLCQKFFPL